LSVIFVSNFFVGRVHVGLYGTANPLLILPPVGLTETTSGLRHPLPPHSAPRLQPQSRLAPAAITGCLVEGCQSSCMSCKEAKKTRAAVGVVSRQIGIQGNRCLRICRIRSCRAIARLAGCKLQLVSTVWACTNVAGTVRPEQHSAVSTPGYAIARSCCRDAAVRVVR